MTALIRTIESLSIWIGRAFGWCILILTLSVSYEVFVRYVLNAPTVWVFDMMVQMYGALFLMAGPYALAQDSHVRGDVLYRLIPVRWQARIDLLYIFFFFPGMLALFVRVGDRRRFMAVQGGELEQPGAHPDLLLKTLIPVAGGILQGIAEILRCWRAMRSGVWLERLADVRETSEALAEGTEAASRG